MTQTEVKGTGGEWNVRVTLGGPGAGPASVGVGVSGMTSPVLRALDPAPAGVPLTLGRACCPEGDGGRRQGRP